MRVKLLLVGLLAAASVLASVSVAQSSSIPSITARGLGSAPAPSAATPGAALLGPAYCNPCLFYSGDLASSGPDGLANSNAFIYPNATVYQAVKPTADWQVTGAFVNVLANSAILDPTLTPWQIRTGVSSGIGGSVYASGTASATYLATGRSAFGLTEYTLKVSFASPVLLHAGVTYFPSVVPQCTNAGDPTCASALYYESNADTGGGTNHFGPANVDNKAFFDNPAGGYNYSPATLYGNFGQFSLGLIGGGAGHLTVTKHLVSNYGDPAKFNLRIDGTTYAANIGDGGTTGAVAVLSGLHTVSETGGIGANMSNYRAGIACSTGDSTQGTSLTIDVPANTPVSCTITNTRKLFKS